MEVSTLKEDILAALKKERNRLNATRQLSDEDEDRLSLCIEYIKLVNQSTPERPATFEVRNFWAQPLRLS